MGRGIGLECLAEIEGKGIGDEATSPTGVQFHFSNLFVSFRRDSGSLGRDLSQPWGDFCGAMGCAQFGQGSSDVDRDFDAPWPDNRNHK